MIRENDTGTPTGLAPSADTPAEEKQKMRAGRGMLLFICGFGLLAFTLYMFIVIYGIFTS